MKIIIGNKILKNSCEEKPLKTAKKNKKKSLIAIITTVFPDDLAKLLLNPLKVAFFVINGHTLKAVFLNNTSEEFRTTMHELRERLKGKLFVNWHGSYTVQIRKAESYTENGMGFILKFKNIFELAHISKRKRRPFIKLMRQLTYILHV